MGIDKKSNKISNGNFVNDMTEFMKRINKRNSVNFGRVGIDMPSGYTISMEEVSRIQTDMLRDYNLFLVEHGVGLSRADLKKKDTIDVRSICTYHDNKNENREDDAILPDVRVSDIDVSYIKSNYWYNYIPCFDEGVLQLNNARYIEWKILKLDVENRQMCIYLRDYFREKTWNVGIKCIADMTFVSGYSTPEQTMINITYDEKETFPIIYRMFGKEDLKWTDKQWEIWRELIIRYADESYRKMEEMNRDMCKNLAYIFMHFITLANQELYLNKPQAVRGPRATKSESSSGQKRKSVVDESNAPHKIIRKVGRIRMDSVKRPKHPDMEVVVHYKTAVWRAKGGVKRLKNGKVVPFKSSIRHRKCMKENENVPQTVIKIRKSKKKDADS